MRKILPLFLLGSILACFAIGQSSSRNYAVEMSAEVSESPPSIKFTWPTDAAATGYTIYRKTKGSGFWGFPLVNLPGTDTTWTDTTVQVGEAWEYNFQKNGSGFFTSGRGYIYAGIRHPVTEERGKIILIVDSTYKDSIAFEIDRLIWDLRGDGWEVIRHDVDRNDLVPDVRSLIQTDYNADPNKVKMVLLLGHVPVPYSGNIAPDGHVPDHQGAWPADVFYGDVDGGWTDLSVNVTAASRPENDNVPLDGKYDHNVIPSAIELMVGRIDFANMPAFAPNEWQLLKRYLDKDHAFRQKHFVADELGVIDDNFGVLGGQEAFAASGWRNFGALVGATNVIAADYRTTLQGGQTHLWSYGCGGGSYTSASGIGNTGNFTTDSLQGVFTMIFGSYHGDWDSQNNFMRAALANRGTILTCAWSGRPHWVFHHMGLGEPIGYGAVTTQNNSTHYFGGAFPRYVHLALLGDPSLRMHIIAPPKNLSVTLLNQGRDNALEWSPSADTVLGYYIYQSANENGPYSRISNAIVNDTSFTDSCPTVGMNYYQVRAINLQEGASGTYYNLSQGVFANDSVPGQITMPPSAPGPLCAGDSLTVNYAISGAQCPAAFAYVELSDSSGSFALPDTLGSVQDTGGGSIACAVTPGTISGSNYLIRVVLDQPSYTSNDNGTSIIIDALPIASFAMLQSGDSIELSDSSKYTSSYLWEFGDGSTDTSANPSHVYSVPGNYQVTLTVTNNCGSDSVSQLVNTVGISDEKQLAIQIWPNPSEGIFELDGNLRAGDFVRIFSGSGQLIREIKLLGSAPFKMDLSLEISGMYWLVVNTKDGAAAKRVVVF